MCGVCGRRDARDDDEVDDTLEGFDVPTGDKQKRDNATELELKAKLEPELPIEPDLTRWLGLFEAPI